MVAATAGRMQFQEGAWRAAARPCTNRMKLIIAACNFPTLVGPAGDRDRRTEVRPGFDCMVAAIAGYTAPASGRAGGDVLRHAQAEPKRD